MKVTTRFLLATAVVWIDASTSRSAPLASNAVQEQSFQLPADAGSGLYARVTTPLSAGAPPSDAELKPHTDATNLTQYVNIFVGTEANDDPGDVFAGASVPYGMAKATINVEGYAPAGYVWPSDKPTRGVSPLHDSGTGSSSGSYGNFCIMPILVPRSRTTLHSGPSNRSALAEPQIADQTLAALSLHGVSRVEFQIDPHSATNL